MHYYNLLMSLFEPFLEARASAPRCPNEPLRINAVGIVQHGRTSLELLLRMYYLRHGFSYWDTALLHFLTVQGYNSLKELYQNHRPYADPTQRDMVLSTVALCLHGLREQSKNVFLAEVLFILMRGVLQPADAQSLQHLFDVEREEERKVLVVGQVRSEWPVDVVSLSEDPEPKRLDRLVEVLAELREETGSSSEGSTSGR
jgi:hypothetical protein